MKTYFAGMHIPRVHEPSAGALSWAQVYSLMASLLAVGVWMYQPGMWAAGLAIAGLVVAGAIEIANPPPNSNSMYRRKKLLQLRRLG